MNVDLDARGGLSRRQFMWLAGMSAAGIVAGCATNPVTGKTQFMTISEQEEITKAVGRRPIETRPAQGAGAEGNSLKRKNLFRAKKNGGTIV